MEPASELCVIEAWRVFPALTGVERAAGALLTGVVPPKSFGPLCRDPEGLFFCP